MASIQVPPDSTGKLVDATDLSDGGNTVYRQKMVVTGASGTAEVATVVNSAPAVSVYGITTHQAGPISLTGTVVVAGVVVISTTAVVTGSVTISGTATVAGSVVISGTAIVAGNVNISATAPVAGSLNVSGSVVVSGTINIFAMGEVPSASRGPRTVLASTSANATLIAAPGAGLCIFVTGLTVTNASGTNSRARVGPSASIGPVMHFTPPWQISANEALLCSVKPNVSEGIFVAHFFVASADVA
jgi:hypothetical protein